MSSDYTPGTENDNTGPGWFWTQAEWAEWSNTLATLLPEKYDDDAAQEAIIERAVMDMATQISEAQAVLTEYEDAGRLPAPYTADGLPKTTTVVAAVTLDVTVAPARLANSLARSRGIDSDPVNTTDAPRNDEIDWNRSSCGLDCSASTNSAAVG